MLQESGISDPRRLRLLEETSTKIAMLEDRCRLLDELMVLRQERDALLMSRCCHSEVATGIATGAYWTVSPHSQYYHSGYSSEEYRWENTSQPVVRGHIVHCHSTALNDAVPVPLTHRQLRTSQQKQQMMTAEQKQRFFRVPRPSFDATQDTCTKTPTRDGSMLGNRPVVSPQGEDENSKRTESLHKKKITSHRSKCCAYSQRKVLPENFRLSPSTVVLGKGRGPKEATGNLKLKELVSEHLEEYASSGRQGKMAVISAIIQKIKNRCTVNGMNAPAFVRFEGGRWTQVAEKDCRVKVTATFRDVLADKYRSSSKSKVENRRRKRQQRKEMSDFDTAVKALNTMMKV
mmetsp:Transcript_26627/g.46936  ORF Transcript_26627/g.46936 Transcript_26627/m.46936 type:complete len:347 (+) Transcript_26627:85-1125(+)